MQVRKYCLFLNHQKTAVMKTLILVRHARADWPENTEDFDRPLTAQGADNAARMARYLCEQQITIDRFYTSPARRTSDTCDIFNKEFGIEVKPDQRLYHPSEENFESVITEVEDRLETIALFSHNNGISNFANHMSEDVFMFPTCGVAGFRIHCEEWSQFHGAKKELIFFYEPKKLLDAAK